MQSQGLCPAGVGRHGVRSLRQSRRLGENHQRIEGGYFASNLILQRGNRFSIQEIPQIRQVDSFSEIRKGPNGRPLFARADDDPDHRLLHSRRAPDWLVLTAVKGLARHCWISRGGYRAKAGLACYRRFSKLLPCLRLAKGTVGLTGLSQVSTRGSHLSVCRATRAGVFAP